MKMILLYLAVVWVVSAVITVYDKLAAKAGWSRISEKNLLLTGLIGGALPMYCVMQMIRHKTKHAKFMILLPLMVFFHIGLVVAYVYFA